MRYVKVNLNLSSLKLDMASIRYFNANKVTQFGPGKGNPCKTVTGLNTLMAELGAYKGNVSVYAYAKDVEGTTIAATLQPSVPVSDIPEIAKAIIAEAKSGAKHGPALKIEAPRKVAKVAKVAKGRAITVPVESESDTRIDAMEAGLDEVKSTLTSIQSMLASLAALVPAAPAPRTRKPKTE